MLLPRRQLRRPPRRRLLHRPSRTRTPLPMHHPRHRRQIRKHGFCRALGLAALAGLLLPAVALAQNSAREASKPVFEEWVLVVLDGKRCGYGMPQVTLVDTPSGPAYLTLNH